MAVSRTDGLLLVVAVAAVSTSAPLIREAAAPALAIAFWRNALASAVLVPASQRGRVRGRREVGRPAWLLAVGAGLLLGAHFAAWIPSLSYTTVSASVALVTTQPVWAALFAAARGERLGRVGWLGIALAIGGALLITGVDVSSSSRALFGDVLALAGGILAAAYVSVGHVARRRLSTTDYTAVCYSVAAVGLLAVCVAGRQPLTGFSARTWLCLVAITIGPQLLGHTVFNRVVHTVGPTVVSVSIVAEIVGAAILAAWWFGEAPPPATVPAAACIIAGVILVVRSGVDPVEGTVEVVTA
ncbi:MAG: DMT family transporter [Acidimicrobiales bacterium]